MDSKSLTKTAFCDKEIDNVTDNKMKEYILENLYVKSKIKYNSRYARIYNENYSKNLNNPHLVCLKSIGSPYLLFCTQINNINYSFLIDKKIKDGYKFPKIFLVHYRFKEDIFNGTLFETELLRDNSSNWHLLIGDIYLHKGETLENKQITERMNMINEIILEDYIDDTFCNICPIKIKKYFNINQVSYLVNDFVDKLNYRIRGLYFVPLKASYSKILYIFTDDEYKKINYKNKTTINFKIIKTIKPEIYELYLNNETKTSIIKHSYACINNIKTSEWIKGLIDKKEDIMVECKLNKKFNKWVPIKECSTIDCISMLK
jgi:hypothetical protein